MTQPCTDQPKAVATTALSPPARQVHRDVLTTFIDAGRAPSRNDVERMAGRHGAAPHQIRAELAERDVVVFDAHGEIRAAYPFAPHPTPTSVTWEGGPTVYSMCAIDALGMSAMLGRPVVITAAEPDTGEVVVVEVDGDDATWIPETAVLYAGSTGDTCCPSADRTCAYVNFFATADAARAWADRHPDISGTVLDQALALSQAVAEFGDLLA